MRSPISKKRWKYLDYRLYYLMRFWLKILRPSLSWQLLQVCVCVCVLNMFLLQGIKKSFFFLPPDRSVPETYRPHPLYPAMHIKQEKRPAERKIKHGSMHMCDESVNFVLILKRVKFSLFSVDSRTKTYHCIFLCMPFIIWKTSG